MPRSIPPIKDYRIIAPAPATYLTVSSISSVSAPNSSVISSAPGIATVAFTLTSVSAVQEKSSVSSVQLLSSSVLNNHASVVRNVSKITEPPGIVAKLIASATNLTSPSRAVIANPGTRVTNRDVENSCDVSCPDVEPITSATNLVTPAPAVTTTPTASVATLSGRRPARAISTATRRSSRVIKKSTLSSDTNSSSINTPDLSLPKRRRGRPPTRIGPPRRKPARSSAAEQNQADVLHKAGHALGDLKSYTSPTPSITHADAEAQPGSDPIADPVLDATVTISSVAAPHYLPYNNVTLSRLEFTELVQWLRYMILSICGSEVPVSYPKISSIPVIIPPRALAVQELHWERASQTGLFRYELQHSPPGVKWEASIRYHFRNAGARRDADAETVKDVGAAYVAELNVEPVQISYDSKTFTVLAVEWKQAGVASPPKVGDVMMGLAHAAGSSLWRVCIQEDDGGETMGRQ